MSTPAGQPLDLPHQIAQMMVMVVPGRLFSPHPFPSEQASGSRFPSVRQLQRWIQSWGLGGIWVQGAPAPEAMLRIQQLQSWAPLPLLVGVNGSVGLAEQFEGTTYFPPPLCLDDLQPLGSLVPDLLREGDPTRPDTTTPPSLPRDVAAAGQLGHFTAREAKAIGLNWLLGLSLEGDPAINCFGSNPTQIAARVAAYARAALAEGVLVSAQLPSQQVTWRAGWTELGASGLGGLELEGWDPPFQRDQFAGLLIADLRQDPLSQAPPAQPEASQTKATLKPDQVISAVQAGVDLLVVDSVEVAVEAITQAVVKGQITPERVAISVHHILEAKARIHPGSRVLLRHYWPALAEQEVSAPAGDVTAGRILPEASSRLLLGTSKPQGSSSSLNRLVPALLNSQRGGRALQSRLAQADAWACAQDLIAQSMTGDGCGQLPLHLAADWLNWIWVDSDGDRPVLTDPAVQQLQTQGMTTLISDGLMPLPLLEKALQDAPHILFQWIGGSQGVHPLVTHLLQDHLPRIAACIFYQHPAQARQWSPILAKNGIPHLHIYGKTPEAQAFALDYLLRSRP